MVETLVLHSKDCQYMSKQSNFKSTLSSLRQVLIVELRMKNARQLAIQEASHKRHCSHICLGLAFAALKTTILVI